MSFWVRPVKTVKKVKAKANRAPRVPKVVSLELKASKVQPKVNSRTEKPVKLPKVENQVLNHRKLREMPRQVVPTKLQQKVRLMPNRKVVSLQMPSRQKKSDSMRHCSTPI